MPNHFLREAPFVRLTLPLIVGIVLYRFIGFWVDGLPMMAGALIVSHITTLYTLPTKYKFRYNKISGLIIFSSITVLGYSLHHLHIDANHRDYLSASIHQETLFQLTTEPLNSGRYQKVIGKTILQDGLRAQGKALLFLEIGEQTPSYGDQIIVAGDLQLIPAPKNPEEFDYQQYMKNQNIMFQAFVPFYGWKITSSNHGNILVEKAFILRSRCKQIIDCYISNPQYIAILHALVLGDKSKLETDLKQTFAATGTMHVLAVSGLHVGIVYLFASSILSFLFQARLKWLQLAISLVVIWGFALLSGLSPSVCRASFMFSVLAVGLEFRRKTSIYNSLACTAFFLLVANPLNIFNVGFQFSFLAVIGIVTLQKPLRNYVRTNSLFWSKVADLSAVSLAAQLATLPLGLYYFGQFPVLFLVSNLFVIPAVTVLVYASLLLFIVAAIPLVAQCIAVIINAYLWCIIKLTESLQALPHTLIDDVYISKVEFLFLSGLVVVGSRLIVKPSRRRFQLALITCTMFCSSQAIRRYNNIQSTELIRFELGRQDCLVLRTGNKAKVIAGEVSPKNWEFHCKPYLISKGVKELESSLAKTADSIQIGSSKYVINAETLWLENNNTVARSEFFNLILK